MSQGVDFGEKCEVVAERCRVAKGEKLPKCCICQAKKALTSDSGKVRKVSKVMFSKQSEQGAEQGVARCGSERGAQSVNGRFQYTQDALTSEFGQGVKSVKSDDRYAVRARCRKWRVKGGCG